MRFTSFIMGTSIVALLSGCASIWNEKTESVYIVASNGKKVRAVVDGKKFTTPATVEMLRSRDGKEIKILTEGCANSQIVPSKISGVFWVNILAGGVLGSSTDYGTDKMWKYDENIVLQCTGNS